MEIDPQFRGLLRAYDLAALDEETATIMGVWADLRLAFVNQGWFRFARENNGGDTLARWRLGASIAGAFAPPVRAFYLDQFAKVLREQRAWDHVYSCSAPQLERQFQLRVLPLGHDGLLLIHSMLFERPLLVPQPDQASESHVNRHGFIIQCAHCRRVQRGNAPRHWDFVPALVETPRPDVSHGLCEPCLAHYFRGPLGQSPDDDV